jgi:hypothetical protein
MHLLVALAGFVAFIVAFRSVERCLRCYLSPWKCRCDAATTIHRDLARGPGVHHRNGHQE